MTDKTFYDRIIEDKGVFDKVIYDLELMIKDSPNPRMRTQAEFAKTYLIQVQAICEAIKKHNDGA